MCYDVVYTMDISALVLQAVHLLGALGTLAYTGVALNPTRPQAMQVNTRKGILDSNQDLARHRRILVVLDLVSAVTNTFRARLLHCIRDHEWGVAYLFCRL